MLLLDGIRQRIEALTALEACARRCQELGIAFEDAVQGPAEAPGRALSASGAITHGARSAALRGGWDGRGEGSCLTCGARFEYAPTDRGRRQAYCSRLCRSRAQWGRRREREDAEWREKTAELRQLHASEGFNAANGAGKGA